MGGLAVQVQVQVASESGFELNECFSIYGFSANVLS